MSKREALSRYNLIINRIRKGPATLAEINRYLQREAEMQGLNFDISRRTFKRDLEDIFMLYKIDIQYDFSKKVYYINEQDQPDLNGRMLEAFDTFNALNMTNGLSRFVYFEKRKPKGTQHFYGLLHAIKNRFMISLEYQKYWDEEISLRMLSPYALKEFKGRWYILAKDSKDDRIKTFALDRIHELEIKKMRFTYPSGLNVNSLFRNCFGIINPEDGVVEKIILSFDPFQGKYLKSYPLHETQEVITDNEEELRLSIHVYITHDLIMEILSYGELVQVIAPANLKEKITERYVSALNLY